MNIYTVHLKGSSADPAALERSIFVREGFFWGAFLLGPLWLLWRRLWIALAGVLAVEASVVIWAILGDPAAAALAALQGVLHLALGFEAAPLLRSALARRRFEPAGVVHGRNMIEAETAFFSRLAAAPSDLPGMAPDPTAAYPSRTRAPDMVGLFPSAGV